MSLFSQITLSPAEVEEWLPRLALLNLEARASVEIVGPPGCGKSEIAFSLAKAMTEKTGNRWAMAVAHAARYTPTDTLGFMIPRQREGGMLVSSFTAPPWAHVREDDTWVFDHEYGVLVLEEFGQAEPDTKKALAELLLEGRLGPHCLPRGWFIVATSNRAQDRSGVTRDLDHVLNRITRVHMRPDPDAWEQWAVRAGVPTIVISFALRNPQIVFEGEVPKEPGPWATPRSLVRAARKLEAFMPRLADGALDVREGLDGALFNLIAGDIGEGAAHQLNAHMRLVTQLPSLDDVLAAPGAVDVPSRPDLQMLLVYEMAAKATPANMDKLLTYMRRLPREFAVAFAKAAVGYSPKVLLTTCMTQFVAENSVLMAAMARK
jgi:energy-coupling factor transporter ATP-binding protein EcfA2